MGCKRVSLIISKDYTVFYLTHIKSHQLYFVPILCQFSANFYCKTCSIFAEETFDDAVSRMGSVLGRSSVDVEAFSGLARRAKEIDAANRKKDEDYDDAPDEFIGESVGFNSGLPDGKI